MSNPVDALILNLLEWIGSNPRPYAEVIEASRTSCPHPPVGEDANERGFLDHHHEPGHGTLASVSAEGAEHPRKHRPQIRQCSLGEMLRPPFLTSGRADHAARPV